MLRKLWPLLLILTSSPVLTSCKGTLPIRPHADVCMVSAAEPSAEEPNPFQGCRCSDGVKVWYLTFKECDKYVAFVPVQFGQLAEYILKLEQMAHKQCGLKATPGTDAIREIYQGYKALESVR